MTKSPTPADAAVETAILEVLEARRNAQNAVAKALQDAARIADDARDAVRRTAERTERRVRAVRAAFDAARRAKVALVDAEAEAQDAVHDLTVADLEQLTRALEALCEDVTGASDESRRRP